MGLNSADELGQTIGSMSKEQNVIKDNISPSDIEGQFQVPIFENIRLTATVIANKLVYATDSFILDHPVYGDIDSSIFQLDGGYDTGDPTHNTTLFETQF